MPFFHIRRDHTWIFFFLNSVVIMGKKRNVETHVQIPQFSAVHQQSSYFHDFTHIQFHTSFIFEVRNWKKFSFNFENCTYRDPDPQDDCYVLQ